MEFLGENWWQNYVFQEEIILSKIDIVYEF